MSDGWFGGLESGDRDGAVSRIREGAADEPADWPGIAVAEGFADDEDEYYDTLHETALAAAHRAVAELEGADDRQLIHAVRAMDDCKSTANELSERVAEWAGSRFEDAGAGVAYAREVADRTPAGETGRRLVGLARRTAGLADEATVLRSFVERAAPEVAPNLSALAGPVLAARLIALAGGLESLAKMPSGTVQVLGAEDALFAHLRGQASSPKHGIIFTHEYVRGTAPADRGSAARALAGKLAIAARIDYYSGDRRPELDAELEDRIARIRARSGETGTGEGESEP